MTWKFTKPCPGCGEELEWTCQQVVPTLTSMGEPRGMYVRYLCRPSHRTGRVETVHKCPLYLAYLPEEAAVPDTPLAGQHQTVQGEPFWPDRGST